MKRLSVASLAVLAACAIVDGPTPQVVIDGQTIRCPNATSASVFQTSYYQAYTCTWYCATWRGQGRQYVQLTYEWDGTAWRLAETFVDAGICGSGDVTGVVS